MLCQVSAQVMQFHSLLGSVMAVVGHVCALITLQPAGQGGCSQQTLAGDENHGCPPPADPRPAL
jgi:hypothetical protein